MDGVDWALLVELQDNARMSYAELGRRVGLTPPAVIERIRRLEDSGVVTGYRVELDMVKVGRPLRAVIRISQNDDRSHNLGMVLAGLPEVLECDRVTGDDCFIMKVAVASPHHLEAFLDHLARYGRTTTSIVLSTPITHRVVEPSESRTQVPEERVRVAG